jgi:TetR/AcrR family transcriptional repressor of mexJK operon
MTTPAFPPEPSTDEASTGRPAGSEGTRTAITHAAGQLFAERGFDGASVDAIAEQAAVSKPTLYRHFENKEAIFLAALRELVLQLPSPEALLLERDGSLRERLAAIAEAAYRLGTGQLMRSLHRMLSLPMQSASYRAEHFWEEYLQPYHDAMQQLLRAQSEAGALDVVDASRAATHFFSLIAGEPMVRLFLTGAAPMREDEADAHVQAAVDAFLRAYRMPIPHR